MGVVAGVAAAGAPSSFRGVVIALYLSIVIAGSVLAAKYLLRAIGSKAIVIVAVVILLACAEGLVVWALDRRGITYPPILIWLVFFLSLVAISIVFI